MKTKIIWNGCDGYIELEVLKQDLDAKFDGDTLICRTETFTAFEVEQIQESEVPRDEDGELFLEECRGIMYYATETGNFYQEYVK